MAASSMRSVASSQSVTSDVTHVWANPNTIVELNSEVALPYKWKQCLNVQTGEIFFINENGQRTRNDPRNLTRFGEDYNSEEVNSYVSDDASSSAPAPVLVLTGCKRCIMYCMMPKRLIRCPKCHGRLLRFDAY